MQVGNRVTGYGTRLELIMSGTCMTLALRRRTRSQLSCDLGAASHPYRLPFPDPIAGVPCVHVSNTLACERADKVYAWGL